MAAAAFAYRSNKDTSSDSDSDDSDKECSDWKRASGRTAATSDLEKIPIDPPVINSNPISNNSVSTDSKRKRNNIWSDVLQDQMISETLTHCGIKNKPKDYGSRGEESYDYTLKYKHQKKNDDSDDQMSEDDDSEKSSVTSNANHKSFKTLKKKFVKLDSAGISAARKIIKVLGEPKQYLIFRVVKFIGIEKAMQLLKMTEDIEENGGMMIKNQQRRRTPGGVFFQLLKSDKNIEKIAIDNIFEGEMNTYEHKRSLEEKKKSRNRRSKKGKKKSQKVPEESHMDEDSMLVEELPMEEKNSPTSVEESANISDLEDGEIAD